MHDAPETENNGQGSAYNVTALMRLLLLDLYVSATHHFTINDRGPALEISFFAINTEHCRQVNKCDLQEGNQDSAGAGVEPQN